MHLTTLDALNKYQLLSGTYSGREEWKEGTERKPLSLGRSIGRRANPVIYSSFALAQQSGGTGGRGGGTCWWGGGDGGGGGHFINSLTRV